MSESWGRIILTPETSSARFHDKVLVVGAGDSVNVSRSSSEEKPDTKNAVFDCRVLSRPQASISFCDGNFYIKDLGSSNGTFINNFRLSKAGTTSDETMIFTDDILKFGSEIETDDGQKTKCVMARIKIYTKDGAESRVRPISDRLYRPKSDFIANVTVKQVKFSSTPPILRNGGTNPEPLEKLEKILTEKFTKEHESLKDSITALEKKLKRKQNENQNLIDNIEKLTKAELNRVSELYDLKEALEIRDKECQRLSDELAVKTKEQLENIKVKDLESEIEDLKKALKFTTEELWLQKEKLRVESTKTKRKNEDNSDAKIQNLNSTIMIQKDEINELNSIITKGDDIIKKKDKEIENLQKLQTDSKKQLQITEGEYSSLRCMMSEENETVHHIQEEMSRLLKIIESDQEIMISKDKEIENLASEIKGLKYNIEQNEAQTIIKDQEIFDLQQNLKQQESLVAMIENYKEKIKESMTTIDEKSKLIEDLNKTEDNNINADEMAQLQQKVEEKEKIINDNLDKSQKDEMALREIHKQINELEGEMKTKEEIIQQLKIEVENERQVASHVQFTQEKELMLKEKELSTLNTILTQERKVMLDKEEEIKKLRECLENQTQDNNGNIMNKEQQSEMLTPARPPRTRSLFITTNMQVEAGLVSNGNGIKAGIHSSTDDNSDTVTYHDALNDEENEATSDEEDVLIEDLELDEDVDDRQPRASDINFDQFSLC